MAARGDVVINEIMYNPASDDREDTYVELCNTSSAPVSLRNWELRGVRFIFPDITIGGNEYLVVCRNQTRIQARYGIANTVGDFAGLLSRDGELLELVNEGGAVVDSVRYADGMPWPAGADGGGASAALINPTIDNDVGEHWAAEVTVNNGWRRLETRGVFDPVGAIRFYLELPGEALVDDVELARESAPGVNLLANAGFESGAVGWLFKGNHSGSVVQASDAHAGGACLHVTASGQGDFSVNHIEQNATIAPAPTSRDLFILSLWVKPLDETNGVTLGSGDGRHGTLFESFHASRSRPERLGGSPGRQNVVYQPWPQPVFESHNRIPTYPAPGAPALVRMIVKNPAAIVPGSMQLHYAVQDLPLGGAAPDPLALTFSTLALTGSGSTFTATIPAQSGGALVRYYVEMTSTNGGHVIRRPAADERPQYYGYYVRSASVPAHQVPVFYLQLNARRKALVDELADDLGAGMFKGYNLNVDADFIDLKSGEYFGDIRTRYRGGVGTRSQKDNHKVMFNDDHRWEGLATLNITPNNQGRSATTLGLANAIAHRLESLFGVPSLNMAQWARFYFNGADRGLLTVVEQPDRQLIARYGLSTEGQLFKAIGWRLAYPRVRADESIFYGAINDGQDVQRKLRPSAANPYMLDEYMSYAYDREMDNPSGYQDLVAFIQSINDIPNSYPMTTADPNYVWLTDCAGSQSMTTAMRNYLESAVNVDLVLRKFVIDITGADTDRVVHNHYWYRGDDGRFFLLAWDRDYWSNSAISDGRALFMQAAQWWKAGTTYPRTWRLPADIHTGSWPTFTAMLWPPEFRRRYYELIREGYETAVTPFTMKNYADRELAYVTPEHALAGYAPTLTTSTLQGQQDRINTLRVAVFQAMQTQAFDIDPALLYPLVADVRHTPPVPAPGQVIEFQAHAVSSVGTGNPTTVTLLLKGPGEAAFAAHAMTRIATDPAYTGAVPDRNRTWYYRAPGLADGQAYEYYVVASDVSGGVRTTVAPKEAPAKPRRVMADGNPAESARGIVINEIMYHSDLPANEYAELTNISPRVVDLSGWSLADASSKRPFVFENDATLAPGEFLVVAGNGWSVRRHYGIRNLVGDFEFNLGNSSDTISLYNRALALVDSVTYATTAPWPAAPDGHGPALELLRPTLDNNNPANYIAAFPPTHRGTPGRPNYVPSSEVIEWKRYD
jgi:hypothetical protein